MAYLNPMQFKKELNKSPLELFSVGILGERFKNEF